MTRIARRGRWGPTDNRWTGVPAAMCFGAKGGGQEMDQSDKPVTNPGGRSDQVRHRRRAGGPSQVLSRTIPLLVFAIVAASIGVGSAFAQDDPPIVPIEGATVAQADTAAADGPSLAPPEQSSAVEDSAQIDAAPAALPRDDWAPPTTVYVAETGHSVDGVFLDLWRGWGGASGFGNPVTPEIEENGRIVQYYAYARLEYWPEDPNGQVVQFGNLGSELRPLVLRRGLPGDGDAAAAAARVARAWLPLDADEVALDGPSWQFDPETEHGIEGEFKAFWEATGGDIFLGDPLSEPYELSGITYQVFQRGTIAQEVGGYPYLVPAGELVAVRRGLDTSPVAQIDLPTYSEALFVPPPDPTPTPNPSPAPGAPDPTAAQNAPLAVDPNAEKWLQVSIGQQYAIARQGEVVLWEGYVSTGKPEFDTPTGTFFVNSKVPVQDMEGVLGGEYYNVPEVPSVMYFTDRGHAIHGTYWHNSFGTPMSHGCINLPMHVAAWMYDWAPVGLRVEIVP